jgi:streptogramin lyase
MFVADRTANRILEFDGRTGEWLGDVATVDRPSSVRLGADGQLYIAAFGRSEILRVDPLAPTQMSRFYMDTEIMEEPVELLFRDRELVVLGHDTSNAIVIDPSGRMVHDVGYPDMRGAHDFAFGADGLLYVATEHDVSLGTAIQIWDVNAGAMVGRLGTLDQLANATGIVALDDELYVTDYERGQLIRFVADVPEVIADDLVHPISIEVGPDELFYIVDERGIHRYTRDGSYVSQFVAIGDHIVGPRSTTFVLLDELMADE